MIMTLDSFHLSEHFRLKERYGLYLKAAGLLALAFHLLAAAFSPPYVPQPYQLQQQPLQAYDIPPEVVVPPAPKPVERPPLPTEMEISTDAPLDMTIPPADMIFGLPIATQPKEDLPFVVIDELPVLVHQVAPVYPELARIAESEGTVVVLATVGETGRVVAAEIRESNAPPSLEKAALEAALQWLFRPAMQRDKPVKAQVTIPFAFSLN